MAKYNYLVEGISGTGKTSVCEELKKRGYNAIDADEDYSYFADPATGQPTTDTHQMYWIWDSKKMTAILSDTSQDVLFVCGGANNRNDFANQFAKIFNLKVDQDTLRQRIKTRTNNSFGKKKHELKRILELHADDDKPDGAIDIDATKPIGQVADAILAEADHA